MSGDVPGLPSYSISLSLFIRFASPFDFNSKFYKIPLNFFHRVRDITRLGKTFGDFSDPTLNFYQTLVLYRFKNMWEREYQTWSFKVISFTNIKRSWALNVDIITQGSSRGQYILYFALLQTCADFSLSIELWLSRWWGLHNGPCARLCRGYKFKSSAPSIVSWDSYNTWNVACTDLAEHNLVLRTSLEIFLVLSSLLASAC